jgi:hypothetical protein
MVKAPKCKFCDTTNPEEFVAGKKNLCKKCKNDRQNKQNEEKRKLLKQTQKPEESKPRSPTPSRESYETFRQAILELNELLMNQKETVEKQTQELQLYKSLSETKFQYLETQVLGLQSENQELKRNINELEESEHSSETSSILSSLHSVTPENTVPSPISSPVRSPAQSPLRINPEKVKIQEIIIGLQETIDNPTSHNIGFSKEELIDISEKYKIKGLARKNKTETSKIIIKELNARLAIC